MVGVRKRIQLGLPLVEVCPFPHGMPQKTSNLKRHNRWKHFLLEIPRKTCWEKNKKNCPSYFPTPYKFWTNFQGFIFTHKVSLTNQIFLIKQKYYVSIYKKNKPTENPARCKFFFKDMR